MGLNSSSNTYLHHHNSFKYLNTASGGRMPSFFYGTFFQPEPLKDSGSDSDPGVTGSVVCWFVVRHHYVE